MTELNLTTKAAANDNALAATKPITLRAQYRAAKDAISSLNSIVNTLLDGQGGIGRRAALIAYSFTIACMDSPVKAAKLPGWDDAAVQPGANPYCQPLKMLADDMNNVVQSKISIWAGVYRHAHDAGITPEHFLEHLKRNHGMRRWYDAINTKAKAANDNRKKGGSQTSPGGVRTPKVPHPVPIDIVQRVADTTQITYAIIDMDVLLCDSDAKAELDSNSAVLGFVQVANDNCLTFLSDNDPRFAIKGAA